MGVYTRTMAGYQLLTTWVFDAPIERVWAELNDPESWPTWWPGMLEAKRLSPGNEQGLGAVTRFGVKAPVGGYVVRFETRTSRVEAPFVLDGDARGGLVGRGLWRLFAGEHTAVLYDWRVRTGHAWMNALAPIARPLFEHNHNQLMRAAGEGLARRMGVRLVAAK